MAQNNANYDAFYPCNRLKDSRFTLAGKEGDLKFLKDLASQFSESDTFKRIAETHSNKLGKTVLHEAAQNGRLDVVKWLLNEVKMDPDCLKQGDWTPLMLASTKNQPEIVDCLIQAGASLDLKNKDGWTPFHIACREGNLKMLQCFNSRKRDVWETKSTNGRTPFHTLALHGHLDCMKWALDECGRREEEREEERDNCGSTPLMDALRRGHISIAQLLISQIKGDPWTQDKMGNESIHLVAEAGCCESLEFLLTECGVPVDAPSFLSGLTPAHFAAKEGHLSCLELLGNFKADFSMRDTKFKRTPLHYACTGQHIDCAEFLLSFPAIWDIRYATDSKGKSPLDYARTPELLALFEKDKAEKLLS